MEKCWFVLRQTHYPAPEYKHAGMAFGEATGPIRLGHFIPGKKKIDDVINAANITQFPSDMQISRTEVDGFRFSDRTEKDFDLSGKAGAPIAAAMGVNLKAEACMAFTRIMGSEWTVDQMDTYIVQPTAHYIEQCLESTELKNWIEKNKTLSSWKLYMISGLMIARGARRDSQLIKKSEEEAGPGVDMPTIAEFELKGKYTDQKATTIAGHSKTDIVWAYRLSEVSKWFWENSFSFKTVKARGKMGTTLSSEKDGLNIDTIMAEEDLDDAHAFEILNENEKRFLITIDNL